jgi:hypothetical protein
MGVSINKGGLVNIFATHPDPEKCAKYLDDTRVIKMTLETAQILSTAYIMRINPSLCENRFLLQEKRSFAKDKNIYIPTHHNHPVVIWTYSSWANYEWLCEYLNNLFKEYSKLSGKVHKTEKDGLLTTLKSFIPSHSEKMTDFANCARNLDKGVDLSHIKDVHLAYRMYLKERWSKDNRPPTWKNRELICDE